MQRAAQIFDGQKCRRWGWQHGRFWFIPTLSIHSTWHSKGKNSCYCFWDMHFVFSFFLIDWLLKAWTSTYAVDWSLSNLSNIICLVMHIREVHDNCFSAFRDQWKRIFWRHILRRLSCLDRNCLPIAVRSFFWLILY